MGKRTTGRAKGKGSFTFQVRKKAYVYRISYPRISVEGKARVERLINSLAHTSPLAKISINNEQFYVPACDGIYEGQEIMLGGNDVKNGNILKLKDIPQGTNIFNIEVFPGSGGKLIRCSGTSGTIGTRDDKRVEVIIKRRRLMLNSECRAIIGVVSGSGRTSKPLVKAGKQHHRMLSRGKKWHRTSPIKTNALDHPFGGGRGKRIKSKIAQINAPPGANVGHIRPRRTGYVK